MRKFPEGFLSSDYEHLESNMAPKRKMYRLADVQDKIEKVAFDVVRFRESDGLENLWVVEERDGEKVLVAMYEEDENPLSQKEATAATNTDWAVIPDKAGNINVFYKQEPITRLAVTQLGIAAEDVGLVSRYLPQKLATDRSMARSLLKTLDQSERTVLFSKHPELQGL